MCFLPWKSRCVRVTLRRLPIVRLSMVREVRWNANLCACLTNSFVIAHYVCQLNRVWCVLCSVFYTRVSRGKEFSLRSILLLFSMFVKILTSSGSALSIALRIALRCWQFPTVLTVTIQFTSALCNQMSLAARLILSARTRVQNRRAPKRPLTSEARSNFGSANRVSCDIF